MAGIKGNKPQSFDMNSGDLHSNDMDLKKYTPPEDNYDIKNYGRQEAKIDSFSGLTQSFDMTGKGGPKVGGKAASGNRVNINDFGTQGFDMGSGMKEPEVDVRKYAYPEDGVNIREYPSQGADIPDFPKTDPVYLRSRGKIDTIDMSSKVGGKDAGGNRVNIRDFGTQGFEMGSGMKEPDVDVKKYAYPEDSINIREFPSQGADIPDFPKTDPVYLKSRGKIDTIDMSSKVGGKDDGGNRVNINDFGTQGFDMSAGMTEPELDVRRYAYPEDSIHIREFPTQQENIPEFPRTEPVHLRSQNRIDTIDMSARVGGNGKNTARIRDFGTQGYDMGAGMKEPEVDIKKYSYPEDRVSIREYPSNGVDIPNFPETKPVNLRSRGRMDSYDMNSKVGGCGDDGMLKSPGRGRRRSRGSGSMGVTQAVPVNIHMK